MNDQSIFVNETGGDEALGEPGASMRKDEIARLFLYPVNLAVRSTDKAVQRDGHLQYQLSLCCR
jgi:hypothetical protein